MNAYTPITESAAAEPARAGAKHARWLTALLEILVVFVTAGLMVLWSSSIEVNPLDRVGQVSGLAGLQFRFVVLGLLVIALLLLVSRIRSGAGLALASRLSCAAIAGVCGGLMGGGLLVILHGTAWNLNLHRGDSGVLIDWATGLLNHQPMPSNYPPLPIYLLARWAGLNNMPVAYAMKDIQLLGITLFFPMAYLAWRLLFKPGWALGIGVVSILPLFDYYKPFTHLTLIVFIPVIIKFLQVVRHSPGHTSRQLLLRGALYGVLLGVLFLSYSGWYVWSAPGVLVALCLVFPWRKAPWRGLLTIAVAGFTFVLISMRHLYGLLRGAGSTKDQYFFFDVFVDPAYIAMWKTDVPGNTGVWPPPGELGGVGVFTFLLVAGLTIALILGLRRTMIITLALCLTSSWLFRFYFASQMYAEQAVQLYPRTGPEILYCLLALSGCAVYLAVQRLNTTRLTELFNRPRLMLSAKVGLIAGVLLLAGSAGSSTIDKFMPRNDNSVGKFAWAAHVLRLTDGKCPTYTQGVCVTKYTDIPHVKLPDSPIKK